MTTQDQNTPNTSTPATPFVHLVQPTQDGLHGCRSQESVVESAAREGNPVVITDSNLIGHVGIYQKAEKAKSRAIIGLRVNVQRNDGTRYGLNLLSINDAGYRELVKLTSDAESIGLQSTGGGEDQGRAIPEGWLFPSVDPFNTQGEPTPPRYELGNVVVLSGGRFDLQHALLKSKDFANKSITIEDIRTQFGEHLSMMKDRFQDRFFVEVQRFGDAWETESVRTCLEWCENLDIPPVATHPNLFDTRDGYAAHELIALRHSKAHAFNDVNRESLYTPEMAYKTPEEMRELFQDIPQALSNAATIADNCRVTLKLGKPELPRVVPPEGMSVQELFAQKARAGLEDRLSKIFPDPAVRAQERARYDERLEHEIGVIQKLGFSDYFLIVEDFVGWCHKEDIMVGPGRGSGAGSLVAYALSITQLDPLPFGLLFERFLNVERVSMPDFDIDFCQSFREKVIAYVRHKYGEKAVAQVGTIGTLAPKGAARAAAKAMGFNFMQEQELAKQIQMKPGDKRSLKEYIFGIPDPKQDPAEPDTFESSPPSEALKKLYTDDPHHKKLFDLAMAVEGQPLNVGMHAAGVVITGRSDDMTDQAPTRMTDDGVLVLQNTKDDAEALGLVKFDFLGLATLTVLQDARNMIRRYQPDFNLEDIPMDDPGIYELLSKGDTGDIFQFESQGMQEYLKQLKPSNLNELIAMVALYRPGPKDFIPQFIDGKHGKIKVEYPHPMLEGLLSETFGIMVYQEQVMQAAQIMAGYSLGSADLLRRAMGKKKPEEMAKQRGTFRDGAAKQGVSAEDADKVFDVMEKFAGYGFNKSHAAVYAAIAAQTAYLKARYPLEFFAACLTNKRNDDQKLILTLDDLKRHNILMLNMDVNHSHVNFDVQTDPTDPKGERQGVRYALDAIKGLSVNVMDVIVEARRAGPFVDLWDFLDRTHISGKKELQLLTYAGALDSILANTSLTGALRRDPTATDASSIDGRPAKKDGSPDLRPLTRHEAGLPENINVFAAFASQRKTAKDPEKGAKLTKLLSSIGLKTEQDPIQFQDDMVQGHAVVLRAAIQDLLDPNKPDHWLGAVWRDMLVEHQGALSEARKTYMAATQRREMQRNEGLLGLDPVGDRLLLEAYQSAILARVAFFETKMKPWREGEISKFDLDQDGLVKIGDSGSPLLLSKKKMAKKPDFKEGKTVNYNRCVPLIDADPLCPPDSGFERVEKERAAYGFYPNVTPMDLYRREFAGLPCMTSMAQLRTMMMETFGIVQESTPEIIEDHDPESFLDDWNDDTPTTAAPVELKKQKMAYCVSGTVADIIPWKKGGGFRLRMTDGLESFIVSLNENAFNDIKGGVKVGKFFTMTGTAELKEEVIIKAGDNTDDVAESLTVDLGFPDFLTETQTQALMLQGGQMTIALPLKERWRDGEQRWHPKQEMPVTPDNFIFSPELHLEPELWLKVRDLLNERPRETSENRCRVIFGFTQGKIDNVQLSRTPRNLEARVDTDVQPFARQGVMLNTSTLEAIREVLQNKNDPLARKSRMLCKYKTDSLTLLGGREQCNDPSRRADKTLRETRFNRAYTFRPGRVPEALQTQQPRYHARPSR